MQLYYTNTCTLVQFYYLKTITLILRGVVMKNESSIDRIIQVNDICIGTNIRKQRELMNVRQIDMVAKLQVEGVDISIYSYNRIEKGTQNPTVSFLYACCKIFRCDMNTLFGM